MRYKVLVLTLISLLAFAYVSLEGDYVKIVFKPSYYNGEVDEVYLFGSLFDYIEMEYEDGRWVALLDLGDGIYDYVFLVNGEDEIVDPEAPEKKTVDGEERGVFAVVKTDSGLRMVKPSEYEVSKYEKLKFGVGVYRGRVYFKLKDDGYDEAYVAGDFTEWEKNPLKMEKFDDFWIAFADMEEGEHQYKYIVLKGGKKTWLKPPNAPKYVDDGFGGKNGYFVIEIENGELVLKVEKEKSVSRVVQKESEFSEEFLKNLPDGLSVHEGYVFFKVKDIGAEKAYLSGTFNNWDPHGIEMKRVNDRWVIWLKLEPGEYQYKYVFVVNGQDVWKEDPNAPGYVPDGFGGKNGIFELKTEDGNLIIEKVEIEKVSEGISGELTFSYKLQLTEDGMVPPPNASDFLLNLSYRPTSNLSFELEFDGARMKSASATLFWEDMMVSFVKGLAVVFDFLKAENYILVKYQGLISAIGWNGGLSYLVGFESRGFKLGYSNDFLVDGGAVFVDFGGKILGSEVRMGALFTDSENTEFFGSVKGEAGSVEFTCSIEGDWDLALTFGEFNFEYGFEDGDSRIKLIVPSFIWDGVDLVYEGEYHTLTSENSIGVVLKDENYYLELIYTLENTGFLSHFITMKGRVNF